MTNEADRPLRAPRPVHDCPCASDDPLGIMNRRFGEAIEHGCLKIDDDDRRRICRSALTHDIIVALFFRR